jgi:hypothetical protein
MSNKSQKSEKDRSFNFTFTVLSILLTVAIGFSTTIMANREYSTQQENVKNEQVSRRKEILRAVSEFTDYCSTFENTKFDLYAKDAEFRRNFLHYKIASVIPPLDRDLEIEKFMSRVNCQAENIQKALSGMKELAASTTPSKVQKSEKQHLYEKELKDAALNMQNLNFESFDVFEKYVQAFSYFNVPIFRDFAMLNLKLARILNLNLVKNQTLGDVQYTCINNINDGYPL